MPTPPRDDAYEPPDLSSGGSEPAGRGADPSNAPPPASERPLSQEEINRILGDFGPAEASRPTKGTEVLIGGASVAGDRMPMLEVVLDRYSRLLSSSMRALTSDNVEVSLESMSSRRFGDCLNAIPLPALISVFKAEEWDDLGLLVIDAALAYSVIDVLLGGRRGVAPMRIEGRPFTTIERDLVMRVVHAALGDLAGAFAPLAQVAFSHQRLEVNPRFAAISRPGNAVVAARLRLDIGEGERGGTIEVLLPHSTLEPIRELLLQSFMGEKFGRDSIWEGHLTQELRSAETPCEAVICEFERPLSEILSWAPGTAVDLDLGSPLEAGLRTGGVELFRGPVGRVGDRIAVMIEEVKRPAVR